MATNKVEANKKNTTKVDTVMGTMIMGTLEYIYFTTRYFIDCFINYVYGLYWDRERTLIPSLKKEHKILLESATSLAKKIRQKELKSEDLVKIVIERMEEVNPIINAITDQRAEMAIIEARKIDEMLEKGVSESFFHDKPFLGVPFTCKESHAVSGMLHTLGIKRRATARATEDAQCVQALKAAGAIPIAVTNVPEINKWQETNNKVFGLTRNPYHTGRTVGGSSGGEAALMSSLATPISLCSDIGGSTRMPAFYCGLFGHNPTGGTTSLKGSALRSGKDDGRTMASIGFISRHSEDLAALTRIVTGNKAPTDLNLDKKYDIEKVKFYYIESASDLRVSPISSDLRNAMKRVVSRLSQNGHNPQQVWYPGFSHMFSLWKYEMRKESQDFAAMLTDNTGRANGILEMGKWLVGRSEYTFAAILKLLDDQILPVAKAGWAEKVIRQLREDLESRLGEDGVLLFPSCSHPAPYHYSAYLRPFNFAYWGIFNVLRFPVTQVPLGLNAEGIPLGIQIVSKQNNDGLCLAVAAYFEELFGGYVPPCAV